MAPPRPSIARGPGRLVAAVALAAMLAACVGPARTGDHYRGKAITSLEALTSTMGAVRLLVEQASRERTTQPYTAVVSRQKADQAEWIRDAFASRLPPDDASDEIRRRVLPLLDEGAALAFDIRLTADRGHLDELAAFETQLRDLLDRLEAAELRLERPIATARS